MITNTHAIVRFIKAGTEAEIIPVSYIDGLLEKDLESDPPAFNADKCYLGLRLSDNKFHNLQIFSIGRKYFLTFFIH